MTHHKPNSDFRKRDLTDKRGIAIAPILAHCARRNFHKYFTYSLIICIEEIVQLKSVGNGAI